MEVKIFWKQECPNCPPAKDLGKVLEQKGTNVSYHNVDEVDGLTESIVYNVMATPSIVLTDNSGDEIQSWRGQVPNIEDLSR
jgi:glutaredoxin